MFLISYCSNIPRKKFAEKKKELELFINRNHEISKDKIIWNQSETLFNFANLKKEIKKMNLNK